VIVVIRLTSN